MLCCRTAARQFLGSCIHRTPFFILEVIMPSMDVGVVPVAVVGSNSGRKAFSVRNASAAGQLIYIDNVRPGGLTVANAAHPLSVGESLHFLYDFDGPDIKLPWSGIASAAAGTLYFKEYGEHQGGK